MGAKAELRCCTLIGAGANAAEEPIRAADRTETSFMVGLLAECEGQEVRVGLWREQPPKKICVRICWWKLRGKVEVQLHKDSQIHKESDDGRTSFYTSFNRKPK